MVVPAVVVSPIVAVLEQADLPVLESGDCAGTAGVALSLVEAFDRVPDPRRARGIRHGLVPLLVLAACAVMTGPAHSLRLGSTPATRDDWCSTPSASTTQSRTRRRSGGSWSTSTRPGCRRRSPPGAWPRAPPEIGHRRGRRPGSDGR